LEGPGGHWLKGVIDYLIVGASKLCLLFLVDALPNGFTLGRVHDSPPLPAISKIYIIHPSISHTTYSKPFAPLANTLTHRLPLIRSSRIEVRRETRGSSTSCLRNRGREKSFLLGFDRLCFIFLV
jgi:hypothetical protein